MSERSKRILKSINNSDLSYGELSKLTGIPKSALQRYATGATEKIPIDRIEAIAKATGVQASYLLCWDSDNSYNEGAEEAALLKKYSQLNSSNKKAVLTLIENLLAAQSWYISSRKASIFNNCFLFNFKRSIMISLIIILISYNSDIAM